MLPEALVIFACATSHGCTETSNQYFVDYPEMKKYFDHEAEVARQFVGPQIVDYAGPAIFFVAGGKGTVKLSHLWSLQFSKTQGIISFRLDF